MAKYDSSKLKEKLEEEYEVGYECDLVENLSADLYECGICHHVLRDAQQTTCCGHSVCRQCIDKALRTTLIDKKCPFCAEQAFDVVPDKRTQRQVLNLLVYCQNKQPGCTWKGELRSREKHLSDDCQFREVKCSNGCQQMVQSRQLEDHLKLECELRQVKCEYCYTTGSFLSITGDHRQKECAVNEIKLYKQQLMETHQKLEALELKYAELQHKFECGNKNDIESGNKNDIESRKKLSAFHALEWSVQLSCLALEGSPGLPAVIKMPQFDKSNQDAWSSQPFTTGNTGYKMFMKVYANGYRYGDGHGKFISVALYLMNGENDEQLCWPVKGTVEVQLLNQLADYGHSRIVEFMFSGCDPMMCGRVVNGSHAERACWAQKFMPHETLQYHKHLKHQYLKDKCIYFRIQNFVT